MTGQIQHYYILQLNYLVLQPKLFSFAAKLFSFSAKLFSFAAKLFSFAAKVFSFTAKLFSFAAASVILLIKLVNAAPEVLSILNRQGLVSVLSSVRLSLLQKECQTSFWSRLKRTELSTLTKPCLFNIVLPCNCSSSRENDRGTSLAYGVCFKTLQHNKLSAILLARRAIFMCGCGLLCLT